MAVAEGLGEGGLQLGCEGTRRGGTLEKRERGNSDAIVYVWLLMIGKGQIAQKAQKTTKSENYGLMHEPSGSLNAREETRRGGALEKRER